MAAGEAKYFYYTSSNPRFGDSLVDVHIEKTGGEEVCAKQVLDYRLSDGGIVSIGPLAC